MGFGVFASASGTSNHGKVEQVEETDAEMQQVQSENGSSPESGDAGGRNSEQVEMHEYEESIGLVLIGYPKL